MERMKTLLITGSPGIGKSTLLPLIADRLPEKNAFVDGDDVGRTRPLTRTIEKLNIMQDNICSCANNYAKWGAEYFLTAFVWPSQERIDRIVRLLHEAGHHVLVIALIADDEALVHRHKKKVEAYGRDAECIRDAVACNNGVKALKNVTFIDTTRMDVEDVVKNILKHIGLQ